MQVWGNCDSPKRLLTRGWAKRAETMGDQLGVKLRFYLCIILGIDGLNPQIVAAMIKEKKLPHFTRLANEGRTLVSL